VNATELEGPYATREERHAAQRLGMFVFLGSETLLFAGLFALYAGYRAEYPDAFARGVAHNEEWIGSVNTLILLSSSALVAWAELAMRHARAGQAKLCLLLGAALGSCFLGLKALEYTQHWQQGIRPGAMFALPSLREPGASLFFTLYYLLTGLHALHVMAGLAALAGVALSVHRAPSSPKNAIRVELAALYWHLVDVVWIFLWPILYLIR
jgi:cytochrome c oxidase subunit 3